MSTAVFTERVSAVSLADTALKAAARLWFVVAVSGQLMFAAYIVWFYGHAVLEGRVEAWDRILSRGGTGGAAANPALLVHLLAAVILIVGGAIQLIPQVRDRAPAFHRWTGRVYLLTALTVSVTGLYMTWIRGTIGDVSQHIGGSLNAVLIILCAVLAVRSAIACRFAAHRRWVLRLFLVVSGAWFYRVGLFLWLLIHQGPAGFDPKTFQGPALTFLSFGNSLVPLAVLELYLRAQSRAGTQGRLAMAAALFALTIAMGIGILGATMRMWLPIIRTGHLSF